MLLLREYKIYMSINIFIKIFNKIFKYFIFTKLHLCFYLQHMGRNIYSTFIFSNVFIYIIYKYFMVFYMADVSSVAQP